MDTCVSTAKRLTDAEQWELFAPYMGYMALLRNLRGMDQAGLGDKVAGVVSRKLASASQVAVSRQLPYRFLSAYKELSSARWLQTLSEALDLSVTNVPAFTGSTLVLVDTSGSMQAPISGKSKITRMEAGAVFGVALAAKSGQSADLFGFADYTFYHHVPRGASVLLSTGEFCKRSGEVGHGTRMADAIRTTYKNHNRVIIISDMQAFPSGGSGWYSNYGRTGDVLNAVPENVPIYAFNTVGYAPTIVDNAPNRYELGGLTDATFKMIPFLERGERAIWPWM